MFLIYTFFFLLIWHSIIWFIIDGYKGKLLYQSHVKILSVFAALPMLSVMLTDKENYISTSSIFITFLLGFLIAALIHFYIEKKLY